MDQKVGRTAVLYSNFKSSADDNVAIIEIGLTGKGIGADHHIASCCEIAAYVGVVRWIWRGWIDFGTGNTGSTNHHTNIDTI